MTCFSQMKVVGSSIHQHSLLGQHNEVQGSMAPQRSVSSNPTLPMFSQAVSPYGTYPTSRCQHSSPMPQPPTPHVRRKSVKKTILLAKLGQRDVNKPSTSRASHLTHTIITSVIVTLNHSIWESAVSHLWQRW